VILPASPHIIDFGHVMNSEILPTPFVRFVENPWAPPARPTFRFPHSAGGRGFSPSAGWSAFMARFGTFLANLFSGKIGEA
jgi:hypothetical protein